MSYPTKDAPVRILNKVGNPNAAYCNQVATVYLHPCGNYLVRIRYSKAQGLEHEQEFSPLKFGDLAQGQAARLAEKINQKGIITMAHWNKIHSHYLDKAGWAPQKPKKAPAKRNTKKKGEVA